MGVGGVGFSLIVRVSRIGLALRFHAALPSFPGFFLRALGLVAALRSSLYIACELGAPSKPSKTEREILLAGFKKLERMASLSITFPGWGYSVLQEQPRVSIKEFGA